jgi:hypothetical protein
MLAIKTIILRIVIYLLRNFMIYIGKKKGLGHLTTIKSSQALDKVLNSYNRILLR